MQAQGLLCTTFLLVIASCAERVVPVSPPKPLRYSKLGILVKDGQPDFTNISISFERTRCFGSCPAYTLSVSGDGTGVYTGKKFVVTEGVVHLTFDPRELDPLLDALEELDFFALNHHCGCWDQSGDSSNASLVVTIGGRSASFLSQMPCPFAFDSASHAALHSRVEQAVAVLERAAGVSRLVGTPEEAMDRRAQESVARAPRGWKRDLSTLDNNGCLFPERIELPRLTLIAPSTTVVQVEGAVIAESLHLVSEDDRRALEHLLPNTSVDFYRVRAGSPSTPARFDLLEARTDEMIARLAITSTSVDRCIAVASSVPRASSEGWWFALYEYDSGALTRLGCGAFELHAAPDLGPVPRVGSGGDARWTLSDEQPNVVIGCWSANGGASSVYAESLYETGRVPEMVTGGSVPSREVLTKPIAEWSEPVVILVASRIGQ